MEKYIYQQDDWPHFTWNSEELPAPLGKVRNLQGKTVEKMESLGFKLRCEAVLETLTLDVVKSAEIEGEILSREQVRLGMDISGLLSARPGYLPSQLFPLLIRFPCSSSHPGNYREKG